MAHKAVRAPRTEKGLPRGVKGKHQQSASNSHLADARHFLPDGEVLGVDGLAVVDAPAQDVTPAPVQLRQRQPQLRTPQPILLC